MNIYARQVDPARQEHTFNYEDFPHIFAWQPIVSHNLKSFNLYWDAEHIGFDVYFHYQEVLASTKSRQQARQDIVRYIQTHYPKLDTLILKPQAIDPWVDTLQEYENHIKSTSEYTCTVLSAYLGYKVHWASYKKLNLPINVIVAEGSGSPEVLDYLWTEMYNAGTEWVLHATDEIPSTAEEVEGITIYCHSQDTERIAIELSEYAGYTGDEPLYATLYSFHGQTDSPIYRKVQVSFEEI